MWGGHNLKEIILILWVRGGDVEGEDYGGNEGKESEPPNPISPLVHTPFFLYYNENKA